MKALLYASAWCMLLCLWGCRSHRAAASSERVVSSSAVDTSRTEARSEESGGVDEVSTGTEQASADSLYIEFGEGGGAVRMASDGSLLFYNIQNIRLHWSDYFAMYNSAKNYKFNRSRETTRQNAISEGYEENETTESSEEFLTPKWYETFFGRLGLGVCFAALTWLLFLYLRRKH